MTPTSMDPVRRARLLLALLWIALAAVLVVFRDVLLPFAVAFLIAYLLEPLVSRLSRLKVRGRPVPRWVAVIGLYVLFFGLLYGFSRAVLPGLFAELGQLSRKGRQFFSSLTPERIAEISSGIEGWLFTHDIPVDLSASDPEARSGYGLSLDLERSLRQGLEHLSAVVQTHFFQAVGALQKVVAGVLEFVFRFFFVLMVAAFMLIDWQRLGGFLRSMVPASLRDDFGELLHRMDEKLAGVVRGQAMICLVNGALTALGLIVLRVPFVFVLSMLATVLSAIPIFGTIISSIPIVAIGLTHGLKTGLGILLWIVGIHALEAYFLNPKIMGAHAKIHPVVVAFSLLAGEVTFGFVGALFAVPVAGMLLAVFSLVHERALARLDGPPASK